MKSLVPAILAAAAMTAACDRAPVTKSEYNNSGASATAAIPAASATTTTTTTTTATTPPVVTAASPAVAGTAPAAESSPTSGKMSDVVSDTVTTGKVKAAIAADPGMKDSDIAVSTTAGVVTLGGTVKSQDQVMIASNLAQRQDGVQKVDANITVK